MYFTISTNWTSYRWPTPSQSIKGQGSEFPAVVVPLAMQHYLLLQRNLVYTAMTRGRRLVVLVGQRKALAIAVRNDRAAERFSCLYDRLVRSQIDPSGRSYSN